MILSSMIGWLRGARHGYLRGARPVWLVLGRLYRAIVSPLNLSVSQRVGAYGPFRFDARFAFSNFANWGQGHNDGFSRCVEACRGKTCVIDVGAHIGLLALPAASVMADGGRLIAFEPAAANRNLLERHIELNRLGNRVVVVGDLVGAAVAEATPFYEMTSHTGMNTIVPGAMGADYRRTERRQVSLDHYCAAHRLLPQVLKIDVEGAELDVLRGARSILAQARPLIFLSVHPRQITLLGESVEGLRALIKELNYTCYNADGTPAGEFSLREYILMPKED